jgi:hypothetical protein
VPIKVFEPVVANTVEPVPFNAPALTANEAEAANVA